MTHFDWLEFYSSDVGDEENEATPDLPVEPVREPSDADGFYKSAGRMREAGNFEAAANLYERALGLDKYHHMSWIMMIDSLVRAKKLRDADEKSSEAIETFGQVHAFYAAKALVLSYRGKNKKAMLNSDISMEDPSPSWYTLYARADVLLGGNRESRPDSLWLLNKALDLEDKMWEVYLLGGMAMTRAELPTMAASFFAEAAHFRPTAPICWLLLGDTFKELRLNDQALFYYKQAEELAPKTEAVRKRLYPRSLKLKQLMQAFRSEDLYRRWTKKYK